MYYQIEQVLNGQQFETGKFYKGRGILVCETNQGLFALKEFHGRDECAKRLFALGEFLQKQNISCDYMVKNKNGELLTQGVDGIRYSCHHWVKGRECDVRSRMDIVMTASFLAKFHVLCRDVVKIRDFVQENAGMCEKEAGSAGTKRIDGDSGSRLTGTVDANELPEKSQTVFERQNSKTEDFFQAEGAEDLPNNVESLRDECLRRDRELRRIRKYVLRRKNKSDFEHLYLSSCDHYLEQSGRVLEFLEKRQDLLAQCQPGICHGDFNQHNVIIASGGMTLVHMEHASYGSQTSDLCHFLRKMLEKHDWSDTLGLETVREYSRIRPMSEADWVELYGRLCYPEKFWKIANHYFNSNKVWDSGNNYEKLRGVIRQDRMRQRFLETFRRAKL